MAALIPAPLSFVLTGPGAGLLASRLGPEERQRAAVVRSGSAAVLDLLECGRELFASRGADAPGQGPFYIRLSEAESARGSVGEKNGKRS